MAFGGFTATRGDHSQPIRIITVWKYQSESGQPIAEDHQRMNLLEDTLESFLKDDGLATLALVSGEDLREWTYYAKSEDEFMGRLNYAFAAMPSELNITSMSCPSPFLLTCRATARSSHQIFSRGLPAGV
jgi:hypothetical protein